MDYVFASRDGSAFKEALGILSGRTCDWRNCRQAGGYYLHPAGGWRRIPTEGGSSDANL